MFTGLVEAYEPVERLFAEGPGMVLAIRTPELFDDVGIGDSIAINGCCLTVIRLADGCMEFQAGAETLQKTTLGILRPGDCVNLERALALGARVGGHLVTGHVDAQGQVTAREDDGQWCTMRFSAPTSLLRQMAPKGSVAIDGVSLTLVDVTDHDFSIALIPHTLSVTTLGQRRVNDLVNLETDLLAKYVQRQLETQNWGSSPSVPLSGGDRGER
ncbi:MAG: riboflavin synthase subunit alpha [Pirellulaceae bacterium]|nr:MAG: riboflavin synthase subunit alpha [Pirellulaceae bacterium]